MYHFLVLTALSALVKASPKPQLMDLDMIDAAPLPTFTQAVGVLSQAVVYDTASLLSQATQVSSVTVSVDNVAPLVVPHARMLKRGNCAAQPTGATGAPKYSPDSASAFASQTAFGAMASAAPVPSGYNLAFTNLNATNNAYGYLGFTTLQSYDSAACAAKCNQINGCMAVNIYFERDPSLDPGSNCPNPSSVTMIKCVFWGGPVDSSNALNFGQMRQSFQVAVTGSNGYVNKSIATPAGFNGPVFLGNAAINAPYDSQGYNTFMGSTIFTAGAFNASLCAAYCTAQTNYNMAHPPTDGSPVQTCQFFNTYIVYINQTSNAQGQYCSIYSEAWPSSYATNTGQYRGADDYLIEYSYTFTNATNPGGPNKQGAIYQARNAITASSLQPYCSSILGYTIPTVTATIPVTTTPLTTVTSQITSTPVTTSTSVTTDINIQVSVSTSVQISTVTSTSTVVQFNKRDASSTLISVRTEDYPNRLLPTQLLSAATNQTVPNQRRAAQRTPDALTQYPATVVSSACSMVASPATSTSTFSSTTTITAPTSTISTSTTVLGPVSVSVVTQHVTSIISVFTTTFTTSTTTTVAVVSSSTTTSTCAATASFAYNAADDCGCSYCGTPGSLEITGDKCDFDGGSKDFNGCAKYCDYFGNCVAFQLTDSGSCTLCTQLDSRKSGDGASGVTSGLRNYNSCADKTCFNYDYTTRP